MVNQDFLSKMKDNAVLINTSRGDVVDEDALLAKLESCPDFWCGLDVFKGEPSAKACDWAHPLAKHPRVYGTHHCGASTN
jgi:D-3-phosphoglycerate dehydrogenase